jgi:cell division protein FtsZ
MKKKFNKKTQSPRRRGGRNMAEIEFERDEPKVANIRVIGVGGAGTNAVDSMVDLGLQNVEFCVINTDLQALRASRCPNKIQIGAEITAGLGAGANPEIGEKAALAAKDVIAGILDGADMAFITAGMGGGTGTGASPVIAEISKSLGILTVAIVTRPFRFEGPQRLRKAEQGIEKLRQVCDTMVVISNERLLEVVGNRSTLLDAFKIANAVLAQGVQSISDLITVPGLINVDFADVRTVMGETGGAVMGVGIGKGENRAAEAVKKACASPLLDKIVIDGAKGILVCITGGPDMKLNEINEATTIIYEAADPNANIIFGAVIDENMKDEMKVTIIATGFSEETRKPALSADRVQPIRDLPVQAGAFPDARGERTFVGAAPAAGASLSLKDSLGLVMKRGKACPDGGRERAADDNVHEPRPARAGGAELSDSKSSDLTGDLPFKSPSTAQGASPMSQKNETPSPPARAGHPAETHRNGTTDTDWEIPAYLRRRKGVFE